MSDVLCEFDVQRVTRRFEIHLATQIRTFYGIDPILCAKEIDALAAAVTAAVTATVNNELRTLRKVYERERSKAEEGLIDAGALSSRVVCPPMDKVYFNPSNVYGREEAVCPRAAFFNPLVSQQSHADES